MKDFAKGTDELWRCQGRVCVLASDNLRVRIMEEAHKGNFTIHLGIKKDVSRLEEGVLVAWDEEGHCRSGKKVFSVPKGEN